jgi:hypothetical protein
MLYSEQFDNAVYTKRNSTISANATTSPDGTTNADKIQEDTSNNRHDIYQDFICTNGVTYTQTIFAKQGERRYCFMSFGTALINAGDTFFDLQDGVVVSSPSGVTSSIQNMGNGWFRCSITATCSSSGTGYYVNGPAITSSNYIYQGVSGYGIYIWGCQIEASSYPTSYIPTTSASATRVADACSKTGISSLIGQTSGTIFYDGYYGNEPDELYVFLQKSGSTGIDNSIYLQRESGGSKIYFNVWVGSTQQALIGGGNFGVGDRIKIAAAYANNDFMIYINGTQISFDTSGTPPTCANLQIGTYTGAPSTANYMTSKPINEVVLFPTRLTNAELASLTTI